jgi:hypothetical protein
VALATHFCFYGNPHPSKTVSKNSLLFRAPSGMGKEVGKSEHRPAPPQQWPKLASVPWTHCLCVLRLPYAFHFSLKRNAHLSKTLQRGVIPSELPCNRNPALQGCDLAWGTRWGGSGPWWECPLREHWKHWGLMAFGGRVRSVNHTDWEEHSHKNPGITLGSIH